IINRLARALTGRDQARRLPQDLPDTGEEGRGIPTLAAVKRPPMADHADCIRQDCCERPRDLAEIALQLALGVLKLHRLKPANESCSGRGGIAGRRHDARRRARSELEAVTDMLQPLPGAIARLQRNDRAADRLGYLLRTHARETRELHALVPLLLHPRIRRDQIMAGRKQLVAITPVEILLAIQSRLDRLRKQILVARTGFERLLHGLRELVG